MLSNGYILNNTSLIGSLTTNPVQINRGFRGVIVSSCGSGFDQDNVSVNLVMGASGSGLVVIHSSKVITQNAVIGPLNFVPGNYCVKVSAGSSITNAFIGIFSTC